jgi:hypothetical protein
MYERIKHFRGDTHIDRMCAPLIGERQTLLLSIQFEEKKGKKKHLVHTKERETY